MDTVPSHVRSRIMSSITGDNLKPEVAVREALCRLGYVFERNSKRLPGKPDFALIGRRTAVFVHGCFWHCCPKHCRLPATNTEFWAAKFDANRRRDNRAAKELRQLGWSVITVWEHDVKLGQAHLRRLLSSRISACLARRTSAQKRS